MPYHPSPIRRPTSPRFVLLPSACLSLCLSSLLFLAGAVRAELPALADTPYELSYEASFMGFKAKGLGSLKQLDSGVYEMRSEVDLRLFGRSVSRLDEMSLFIVEQEELVPLEYHYEQSGLGGRSRRQSFDYEDGLIHFSNSRGSDGSLTFTRPVLDMLNAVLYLRSELANGSTDITYTAMDKEVLDTFRFQVVGEDRLDTAEGGIDTLIVERIREPESQRSTRLWFAPAHDYILVKLEQIDGDGRRMEMMLDGGHLDGESLDMFQ